jgi:hypothetical protein
MEILQVIDDVSWQVIQSGPGGISQVDGEELDDEKVIVRFTRSAHEAIVLHPDGGVSFAIVLDDVARCSKTLWETSIMYGVSERVWARPFRTVDAPFTIIVASVVRVLHASLGLRVIIPWAASLMYLRF